jgi:hypothetical protein
MFGLATKEDLRRLEQEVGMLNSKVQAVCPHTFVEHDHSPYGCYGYKCIRCEKKFLGFPKGSKLMEYKKGYVEVKK